MLGVEFDVCGADHWDRFDRRATLGPIVILVRSADGELVRFISCFKGVVEVFGGSRVFIFLFFCEIVQSFGINALLHCLFYYYQKHPYSSNSVINLSK